MPTDILALKPGHSSLTLLMNGQGGVVDDGIITNTGENGTFYLVTNGATRDKDMAYIKEQIELLGIADSITHETLDPSGLIALQGPRAVQALQHLVSADLSKLKFGQSTVSKYARADAPVRISRGGYTGEDGVEISISPEATPALAEDLLRNPSVKPIGLAARDSLRLEAGMCLYGHDLDDTTSPLEASLAWVVGKRRREEGGFLGYDVYLKQKSEGVKRKRVGFIVEGAPAREGAIITDPVSGQEIGKVTSGVPSPTLGKFIGMGYIDAAYSKADTPIAISVRSKPRTARVAKMPFIAPKYYK